jgi:hypothetical protein
MENYVIHGKLCDSWKTMWFMENYVIHGKLRDSRGPCRDYVGILICFVKNYVVHEKPRESWKTRWWLSRWKKSRRPLVTFSSHRNWYCRHSWETQPKLRNNWLSLCSNVVCFMCRFNSFSPGQKAIHVRGLLGDSWKPQVSALYVSRRTSLDRVLQQGVLGMGFRYIPQL